MSRIAGFIGPSSRGRWDAMLAASRSLVGGEATAVGADGATLGWCGRGAAEVAERDGVAAVIDGAIYNSDELNVQGTTAARLLALYVTHGFSGALSRINGEFAGAVYDSRTKTLHLGRDRFGVKPLYYAKTPDGFALASRPRALLTLPGVSRRYNRHFVALCAASHYRYFDNAPHES